MVEKQCTKCKTKKPIESFYKNKLSQDGHSIYCVDCTKINSKNYFERKKVKDSKIENENLMKMALLDSFNGKFNEEEVNQLMKVMLIEKMVNSIIDELSQLKRSLFKNEQITETGI